MEELRPLALGEIVDRSASFWRQNFLVLFRLFIGFELVQFALIKTWELTSHRYLPEMSDPRLLADAMAGQGIFDPAADPGALMQKIAVVFSGFAVAMVVSFWLSTFCAVAATRLVMPKLLGEETSLGQAVGFALSRFGAVSTLLLLTIGWTLLVSVLFMLPGLLLTVVGGFLSASNKIAGAGGLILGILLMLAGAVLAVLWFIVRFVLSSQVLAMEPLSGFEAFRRSGALSSGRIGPGFTGLVKVRLTVLVTVVGAVLLVIGLVTGLPALVIQGIYGGFTPGHTTPDAVPQLLMVPAQLLQVVAQSFLTPFYVVFQTVFYMDMRVRREALDLTVKLAKPA